MRTGLAPWRHPASYMFSAVALLTFAGT
jgi:hypothetical protein